MTTNPREVSGNHPYHQDEKKEDTEAKLREALLNAVILVGDMYMELIKDQDRVFDKSFPWNDVNSAVWYCAEQRKKFFADVPLWELTRNRQRAESYRRTLDKTMCHDCGLKIGTCNCK